MFQACSAEQVKKIDRGLIMKFMHSQGYTATEFQLDWLIQRMDHGGKGHIRAKDIKIGLAPKTSKLDLQKSAKMI